MGDMGDYWRGVKEASREYKQRKGWVSQQYKTEKDQEVGRAWKYQMNADDDKFTMKELKKLKLNPVLKNTHSFQVTINGRKAMYYNGKREKLIFTDGEQVSLPYYNSLEEYVKEKL